MSEEKKFDPPLASPPASLADAPRFTTDDSIEEKAKLTEDEKAAAEADLYGQVHPNETPQLVSESLTKLDAELDGLPDSKKVGWMKAKERCPELTDEKHKLMFLRCEVFNVDLAAIRLVAYWDKRIEIFGDDKAFLPLTLDGALRDDAVAISMGFFRLTGTKDNYGRAIVYGDPARQDPTKYERESMVRALWYCIHAALEDEMTQKKGCVFIACPRNAKLSLFDRKLAKMNMESMRGFIPVRISGLHICHPPSFFAIIFPILKYLMGQRLRQRIKVHSGSDEKVLKKLDNYGIPKDRVPSDIGGNVVLDQVKWMEDRREAGM